MIKIRAITVTILVSIIALFLISCGGLPPTRWNTTMIKDDQSLPVPSPDTAVIVFLTGVPNNVIYDVTSESPELVGVLNADTKIAYEVTAGEHYFMTLFASRFMVANVTGGKTYYILLDISTVDATVALVTTLFVSTIAGASYGNSGQLVPVRNGGEGRLQYSDEYIQEMLEDDKFVELTQKAQEYYLNETWTKNVKKTIKKELPKFKNRQEKDLFKFTLNPEDGISANYYFNQNTQISQGVETESNTVQPSIDDQEELQTLALENPEPKKSVPSTYTSNLRVLMTLRDDGIISEDEFQKRKTEILASTQRIQTPAQPKPRIREVDPHEIRYIVGDPSGQNYNSSTSGGVRKQHGQGVVSQSADKGTSKQPDVTQNDSNDAKKTEWVREVGGKKFHCVRTTDQTICR